MIETSRSASNAIDFVDLVLLTAFVVGIGLWHRYQRRVLREQLEEEAATGLISRTEWILLPRYWQRTLWYWQLMKTGQWERLRLLRRIHNELVNLALTKNRIARGKGQRSDADRSRRIIVRLKAQKAASI